MGVPWVLSPLREAMEQKVGRWEGGDGWMSESQNEAGV